MYDPEHDSIFEPEEKTRISRAGYMLLLTIVTIALTIIVTSAFTRAYGYALYIALPLTIGFAFGFVTRPNKSMTLARAIGLNFFITLAVCALLFLLGVEGGICLIIIVGPLYLELLVGFVIGRVCRNVFLEKITPVLAMLLLNPACIVADMQHSLSGATVTTEMVIHAPADKVWQVLQQPVPFGKNANFFFRNGVNYPLSMQLIRRNDSNLLHCELRNGANDMYVDQLEANHIMRFKPTVHVVPMKEFSIYGDINTPHTHSEYFSLNYGSFELQPMAGGNCKIIATSDVSYRLSPQVYWNLWGCYLVNRMHTHVLDKVRAVAENPGR